VGVRGARNVERAHHGVEPLVLAGAGAGARPGGRGFAATARRASSKYSAARAALPALASAWPVVTYAEIAESGGGLTYSRSISATYSSAAAPSLGPRPRARNPMKTSRALR